MLRLALLCSTLCLVGPSDDGPDKQSTGGARAVEDPGSIESFGVPVDRQAALRALERGLAYLAKRQESEPDGSLPGGGEQFAPTAVTALGALAWMAGGNTLERGPQGRPLGKAVDYLLAKTQFDVNGPEHGYISAAGDNLSRMHGHGFATTALAQAFSVSQRTPRGKKIEHGLRIAARSIEASQQADGGWGYHPTGSLNHEGSVTITVVQALRAAHNSGLEVDVEVIAKAIDYVARSQKEDGSFKYSLSDERSTVSLTAAAIATLNATGDYSSKALRAGYDFLFRTLEARETAGLEESSVPRCEFYERLYLAQAFWQHPEESVFQRWVSDERSRVLKSQNEDGSWSGPQYGDCYATAMNCLFLALPEGLLPIFQR